MRGIVAKSELRAKSSHVFRDVTPPDDCPKVDVIVPFHAGDARYVEECLQSLLRQQHVKPIIHCVSDGCEWPRTPRGVIRHQGSGGEGPYLIANRIAKFCQSEFIAIQDADDVALPHRLWRQVQLLRLYNAEMVSSGMRNFAGDNDASTKAKVNRQPVIMPGEAFSSCQQGRLINGTRMMRTRLFFELNGFANICCSADFDFDNRCRFSGVRVIDDTEIVSERRIHSHSLSHGIAPMGSQLRNEALRMVLRNQELMRQNPTREQAAKLGAMQCS